MPDTNSLDRVDGRAKVTGTATYSAEYKHSDTAFGFLVGSTIAKGNIKTIDTKAAERAPGVLTVITYLNSFKIPGYQPGEGLAKDRLPGQQLRIFYSDEIFYYDQPIALVVADTYERVRYAASLIKATYTKVGHETDINKNLANAKTPAGPQFADYVRGTADAYKNAAVKIEAEYIQPIEVHSPMELGSTIAKWDGDDKITVYTKTQGVESTKNAIKNLFKLKPENITVNSEYVGGAFGMALRTWPYEVAAILGAKKVGRPVKLMLTREQQFTNVGDRPYTIQKLGLGASLDGKLTGLTHEATAHTSSYEDFTENTIAISKFLYACPNVNTKYKITKLDVVTPIWMRGPGEATGSFALESAMDELAYALNLDPIEFRLRNYADTDPEKNRPWSSKYLKECYDIAAKNIGWHNRSLKPGGQRNGDWFIGYGMGTGTFGAFRNATSVRIILKQDGSLVLECSVNDMGPGTATMMTKIAEDETGISHKKIKINMGSTGLPPGPTQGGSATTSSAGGAVHEACTDLKAKLAELVSKPGNVIYNANTAVKITDLKFEDDKVILTANPAISILYSDILKQNNLTEIALLKDSKGNKEQQNFSMYSFSVHFVKLQVHATTGRIKLLHCVSCADAGTIINEKTAAGQMAGGAVGGIGMAMMEDLVYDHRFGRAINNNFADYHVPVNADIPKMDVYFVNKKDPYTNPMGSKGLGEISLVGMAPAIANAVFNATGKRVRELPITLDKVM